MASEVNRVTAHELVTERGITENCVRPSCPSFQLAESINNDGSVSCPSCGHAFIIKILDGAVWTAWRHGLEEGFIEHVDMPELRSARRERFVDEFGLSEETASKLTSTHAVADFFETLASETTADIAATFVADTLLGELHYRDMRINAIDAADCVDIVSAIAAGNVTWRAITPVVRTALDNGRPIDTVFSEADISKTDADELDSIVDEVVASNEDAVVDYQDGKTEALNSLIGAVMQATEGQADAKEARERLIQAIDE